MDPVFSREITLLQKLPCTPQMFKEWAELAKKWGTLPNFDWGWGGWGTIDIENPEKAAKRSEESIHRENKRVENWNKKAKLLEALGENHPFVRGYLADRGGPNRPSPMRLDQDWLESEDNGVVSVPRSCLDFLKTMVKDLLSKYPNTDLESVSYYIGRFSNWKFRYSSALPQFDGVDINDGRPLNEAFTKEGEAIDGKEQN